MKLLGLILMLVVQVTYTQLVYARNQESPEQRAKMLSDSMTIRLHLTTNQQLVIRNINLKYAKKMQKEVIETDKSKLSKYMKATSIFHDKDDELKKILTKEQFDQYQKMKSEQMKKLAKVS